jgi:predicted dehydrogenase
MGQVPARDPHTLLVEGGIHHLDQIRNLTSSNCQTITGYEWHPGQQRGDNTKFAGSDSFDGEPCSLYVMQMDNGSFAQYEGNNLEVGRRTRGTRNITVPNAKAARPFSIKTR